VFEGPQSGREGEGREREVDPHNFDNRSTPMTTTFGSIHLTRELQMYGTAYRSVITAPSVNSFKNRLDKHWASQELI